MKEVIDMAQTFDTGVKPGRNDVYLFDPADVLVDDSLNRRLEKHSDTDVLEMVKSFEEQGQLQPVIVRKLSGGKVQLAFGYRRYWAAVKYNELHPEKPMRLAALVKVMNDEEAVTQNIVENIERKATSPLEDALNQRDLRERFGWSEQKIADLYKKGTSWTAYLKKLLLLPEETRMRVHRGELSVDAACALADLPEAEQREVIARVEAKATPLLPPSAEAPKGGTTSSSPPTLAASKQGTKVGQGKGRKGGRPTIRTKDVVDEIRKKKNEKGQAGAPRSLADLRTLLEGMMGPAEDQRLITLCNEVLKFLGGKTSDEACEKAIRKAMGVK